MNNKIIIILGIVLLIFIILNHINIITTTSEQGNCSQTAYGCCPNNKTSKINPQGNNCSLHY